MGGDGGEEGRSRARRGDQRIVEAAFLRDRQDSAARQGRQDQAGEPVGVGERDRGEEAILGLQSHGGGQGFVVGHQRLRGDGDAARRTGGPGGELDDGGAGRRGLGGPLSAGGLHDGPAGRIPRPAGGAAQEQRSSQGAEDAQGLRLGRAGVEQQGGEPRAAHGEERGEEARAVFGGETDERPRSAGPVGEPAGGGAGQRVDLAHGRPPLRRHHQRSQRIAPDEPLEGVEDGIRGHRFSSPRGVESYWIATVPAGTLALKVRRDRKQPAELPARWDGNTAPESEVCVCRKQSPPRPGSSA
jgi:hypothetical protein